MRESAEAERRIRRLNSTLTRSRITNAKYLFKVPLENSNVAHFDYLSFNFILFRSFFFSFALFLWLFQYFFALLVFKRFLIGGKGDIVFKFHFMRLHRSVAPGAQIMSALANCNLHWLRYFSAWLPYIMEQDTDPKI